VKKGGGARKKPREEIKCKSVVYNNWEYLYTYFRGGFYVDSQNVKKVDRETRVPGPPGEKSSFLLEESRLGGFQQGGGQTKNKEEKYGPSEHENRN